MKEKRHLITFEKVGDLIGKDIIIVKNCNSGKFKLHHTIKGSYSKEEWDKELDAIKAGMMDKVNWHE